MMRHTLAQGHTAHATAEQAEAMALAMVREYADFAERTAALPVVAGRKSRVESFAGAVTTYTIEAMMGDRRALQVRAEPAAAVLCACRRCCRLCCACKAGCS
jgi:prolyl-tRNA synthetase